MYKKVQIFVENQELELFNDEKIVVTSSVQNISDIGKVFTDFSQTFTIPCTAQNNYIFEHYYNNDVDNVIDHQLRRSARIEIDTDVFRTGKVQIEKSVVKEGMPQSYSVTFFGDVVTLKDLIGEDKLSDLSYDSLNHDYSGEEVENRVKIPSSTTDYNVRYPLITSGRVWQYGDATTNDISTTGGAIDYTELFPAVRVASLFDDIETKYGVSFTGYFLSDSRFRSLFLWYKNKENLVFYSKPVQLRFAESGYPGDLVYDGIVNVNYTTPNSLATPPYDVVNAASVIHTISVEIGTGSSIDYFLDIYENGQYMLSFEGNGTQTFNVYQISNLSLAPNGQKDITFFLRSASSMTFSTTVNYTISFSETDIATSTTVQTVNTYSGVSPTSQSTVAQTDLASLAPDMRVYDFISGIFNLFNLTCYAENETTFKIEPLDTYYNTGREYDITEYVVNDEITYERPKLYKNILFEWQQCNSFMNREFFDLFRREYGNLRAEFDYDGGDFQVKLPFETPLHSKFTGTEIQVGYSLGTEPEYKNYIPKPTLLYMYDWQDTNVSFYLNNGSTDVLIEEYVPFGQDMIYNQDTNTLNWGSEISSMELEVVNNTLYRTFYESYILNLYNPKTRIVYLKAKMPNRILHNLKMNDNLLIRDKRYIINEMKTDLTTGDCDLVLINNFRPSISYDIYIQSTSGGGEFEVPFSIPTDTVLTIQSIPFEVRKFTTISSTKPANESILEVNVDPNVSFSPRINNYPITVVNPEGTFTFYLVIYQEELVS